MQFKKVLAFALLSLSGQALGDSLTIIASEERDCPSGTEWILDVSERASIPRNAG